MEPLLNEDRDEALAFLARRPRHTVIMAGLLRHYGPVVPLAQGMFYTCRDARGRLEGLALVGRATMFEAQNGAAISALARGARRSPAVRMIMGEADELETFWRCYIAGRQEPRLFCREIFYESSRQFSRAAGVDGLRQATLDDLDQIVQAHAQMVFEESGVNPLADDAEGFRHRCAQRVEQGQVWTLIDKGELIFKADVLTQTPEASYIEGVWVNPAHRLKGYGRNCWASLSRTLLDKAPAFCWFVNAQNSTARSFYDRVGAVSLGEYNKVYL
ncbi:MAG TPA: GNAT family N-acetyltransferase [Pyrinomonadaceae bacterium]